MKDNRIYGKLMSSFLEPFLTKNVRSSVKERIGLELELLIVKSDGTQGDNSLVFDLCHKKGLKPIFGTNFVYGYEIPYKESYFSYTFKLITEAGVGTLEINIPPVENLHNLSFLLKYVVSYLTGLVKESGQFLLGYGIQPAKNDSIVWFSKNPTYDALKNTLKKNVVPNIPNGLIKVTDGKSVSMEQILLGVDNVTRTASLQPHWYINSPDEAILGLYVMNLLAPVFIALFRNSPVHDGRVGDLYAIREAMWHGVHPVVTAFQQGGMPELLRLASFVSE